MKKDVFQEARGGWSRMLDISCSHGHHICYYQKDGPGPLKRMYLDRMFNRSGFDQELVCPICKRILGVKIIYQKEHRAAYRLFQDAVKKKIIAQEKITNISDVAQ